MEPGPCRRPDIPWVVIDGEVVLIDAGSGAVHVLGGAVSAVWQLLDGDAVDGLASIIADEFGLDDAVVEADLAASLAALDDLGVLAVGLGDGPGDD